jgi:hypothetical protein
MHAGFCVHENLLLTPESESSAARQPQTAVALEQGHPSSISVFGPEQDRCSNVSMG